MKFLRITKKNGLILQHEETDLVEIEKDIYGRPQRVAKVIAKPWFQMRTNAKKEGIVLNVVSAFRPIGKQIEIIERKMKDGSQIEEILKVSAAPGYSEHHSGRVLDLTTPGCKPLEEAFDTTEAFNWLQENANLFSFRSSYPKNNKYGFAYEPWHWKFTDN